MRGALRDASERRAAPVRKFDDPLGLRQIRRSSTCRAPTLGSPVPTRSRSAPGQAAGKPAPASSHRGRRRCRRAEHALLRAVPGSRDPLQDCRRSSTIRSPSISAGESPAVANRSNRKSHAFRRPRRPRLLEPGSDAVAGSARWGAEVLLDHESGRGELVPDLGSRPVEVDVICIGRIQRGADEGLSTVAQHAAAAPPGTAPDLRGVPAPPRRPANRPARAGCLTMSLNSTVYRSASPKAAMCRSANAFDDGLMSMPIPVVLGAPDRAIRRVDTGPDADVVEPVCPSSGHFGDEDGLEEAQLAVVMRPEVVGQYQSPADSKRSCTRRWRRSTPSRRHTTSVRTPRPSRTAPEAVSASRAKRE